MSYLDNPCVCAECGVDLFPNYMEGAWEHFTMNKCRFAGKSAYAVGDDFVNLRMLGPRKQEGEP